MQPPTERDPRVNPKAGDLLFSVAGEYRHVKTCRKNRIEYFTRTGGGHWVDATCLRAHWTDEVKNYEVIHAAD